MKRSREARQDLLDSPMTSSPVDLFGYHSFTYLCDKLPIFQNVFQLSEPVSLPTSDLGFSRGLMVRDPTSHVLQIVQRKTVKHLT